MPLNILVVGGTGFLGGAVADAARRSGHRVSILSRGQMARSGGATGAEHLVADRHGDLSILKGRSFDLVVDTCAYVPSAVDTLLTALDGRIGIYALVSSISVYSDFSKPDMTEAGATDSIAAEHLRQMEALPPAERSSAAAVGAAYGPLKRACEVAAIARLGELALIIRAGLLVGRGDYTDRMTFWVRRIDQGGRIPAPGDPHLPVQMIDVRDAAEFIVRAGASETGGVFNLTGTAMSRVVLFDACAAASGSTAVFDWRPDQVFLDAGLKPWSEVPLWIPASRTDRAHFLNVSVAKAAQHGLSLRPVADTLGDILAWDRGRRHVPLKAGWLPEQEAKLR